MKLAYISVFFLEAVFFGSSWHAVQAEEIQWKVENRFTVFRDASDFQRLESAFGGGSAMSFVAQNLSAAELRKLMPIERTAWEASTGLYKPEILFIKHHDVEFTVTGSSISGECTWQVNNSTQTVPCAKGVIFQLDERTPFSAQVSKEGTALATLSDQIGITSKLIVGLGDSFASGEGNPDHPTVLKQPSVLGDKWFIKEPSSVIEQSATWWDKACHRSLFSWQALYALRQAISDPHRVVQFASFACSGAEVYDGFFRAQISPPGSKALRIKALSKSQQEALVTLLCTEGIVSKRLKAKWHDEIPGPRHKQKLFGDVNLAECSSTLRQVDEMLISFGGNDFGFSGVVKWGIGIPDSRNHKADIFGPLRYAGIATINKFIEPILPAKAAASLSNLKFLYEDLEQAMRLVNLKSLRTTVMVYPDPLPTDDYEGCKNRSRDGNLPLSFLIDNPFSNYKFGISQSSAMTVRSEFIKPLRAAQFKAIAEINKNSADAKWLALDANGGFENAGNPRTMCATSPSCTADHCDISNRLTWVNGKNFSCTPSLNPLTDFLPYTSERARGLRYASDALLTQSALFDGKLDGDWMSGISHPTANVHSEMADKLFTLTLP